MCLFVNFVHLKAQYDCRLILLYLVNYCLERTMAPITYEAYVMIGRVMDMTSYLEREREAISACCKLCCTYRRDWA